MANVLIRDLIEATSVTADDLLELNTDPSGTPLSRKATVRNVLRASEDLVTGASPVVANQKVLVSLITSGGTASNEQATLPTITDPELIGLQHLFVFETQTNPGDIIDLPPVLDGGAVSLTASGDSALYQLGGALQWELIGGLCTISSTDPTVMTRFPDGSAFFTPLTNTFPNVDPWKYLGTDTGSLNFRNRYGVLFDITEDVTLGAAPVLSNTTYLSRVDSGATAGVENFSLSSGYLTGARKLIRLSSLNDPGDIPTLSVSNLIDQSDAEPSSIVFSVVNDELFVEWQQYKDGGSGKWVIIGASSGVVTP